MADFTKDRKSLAQLVLLGVFILGLALAWLMVRARSDINMSSPIAVPFSGAKISVPSGSGWQKPSSWIYSRNAFNLVGYYGPDQEQAVTQFAVSLNLASGKLPADQQIQTRADQLGGAIRAMRSFRAADITVKAAWIEPPGSEADVFFAVAPLPHGRSVVIEIIDQAGSSEWGWAVCEAISKTIQYKPDPLVEAGAKTAAAVRSAGVRSYLQSSAHQRYHIIQSPSDSSAGFSISLWATAPSETYNTRLVDSYYIHELGGEESVLQTADNLSQWVWIANVLTGSGERTGRVESYLNSAGQLISKSQRGRRIQVLYPGEMTIPDPVLDSFIEQMIKSSTAAANIELLTSEARIIPALIKVEKAKPAQGVYAVTVEHLDGSKTVQTSYLNKQLETTKSVISGKAKFVLEQSSRQNILQEFSIWSEYIESLDDLLRDNMKNQESRRNPDDPAI